MTVELADGTVARSGGRVVKNVAGYDLGRLFTGARAAGAIRQLWLRLHPLPADTCTVVSQTVDPRPLEALTPACVEYAWPAGRMLVRFESPVAGELGRAAARARRRRAGGGRRAAVGRIPRAGGRAGEFTCLPAADGDTADPLRGRGATKVVGRLGRGRLYADLEPDPRRRPPSSSG